MTDGTKTVTLATNTYDGNSLQNITSSLSNHDSAFGLSQTVRGNLTKSVTPGGTADYYYDITGAAISADDANGHAVAITNSSSNNYAVPAMITPNSQSALATSMNWSSFLGLTSQTGPNSATASIAYYPSPGQWAGLPKTSTSPYSAVTTYTYTNASGTTGATSTATVNGRWTTTTYDGLGRPVHVQRGSGTPGTNIVSTVDTVYGSGGCSPLGKMTQTSMPYAPTNTEYWEAYNYDGMGRTISVVAADGASTTNYTYGVSTASPQRTTATISDPASHTKEYFNDGLGQLTQVIEDPGSSPHFNYTTTYAYDVLSHLVQVKQGAQTRAFNYNDSNLNVTALLQSATNPENLTVTIRTMPIIRWPRRPMRGTRGSFTLTTASSG